MQDVADQLRDGNANGKEYTAAVRDLAEAIHRWVDSSEEGAKDMMSDKLEEMGTNIDRVAEAREHKAGSSRATAERP